MQKNVELWGDRHPWEAALHEPHERARTGAELPNLTRVHFRGPIQGPPQPSPKQPQALVRLVVVLWGQTEEGSANGVAPLRNGVAITPNEYTTMVGGWTHTHNAAKRLGRLVGNSLPIVAAAARDHDLHSQSQQP